MRTNVFSLAASRPSNADALQVEGRSFGGFARFRRARGCRDARRKRARDPQQPAPDARGGHHRGHAPEGRPRHAPASRRNLFRVSRHRAIRGRGLRRSGGGISATEVQRSQHPRHRRRGPAAVQFAIKFRDSALRGVPVVHVAMPQDQVERMSLPPDVIGKTVDLDPVPTLELAFRLHPDAKRLVFVLGAAERDRVWERRMRAPSRG